MLALALAGCASSSRPLQLIGGADLVYPAQARAAGIEGRVVVHYDVTVEGVVVNAMVAESEPSGLFDAAALAAVRSWRFKAPVDKGQVVAAPDRVSEVIFRLAGNTKGIDKYVRRPASSTP